jgi:hypothetical protein
MKFVTVLLYVTFSTSLYFCTFLMYVGLFPKESSPTHESVSPVESQVEKFREPQDVGMLKTVGPLGKLNLRFTESCFLMVTLLRN